MSREGSHWAGAHASTIDDDGDDRSVAALTNHSQARQAQPRSVRVRAGGAAGSPSRAAPRLRGRAPPGSSRRGRRGPARRPPVGAGVAGGRGVSRGTDRVRTTTQVRARAAPTSSSGRPGRSVVWCSGPRGDSPRWPHQIDTGTEFETPGSGVPSLSGASTWTVLKPENGRIRERERRDPMPNPGGWLRSPGLSGSEPRIESGDGATRKWGWMRALRAARCFSRRLSRCQPAGHDLPSGENLGSPKPVSCLPSRAAGSRAGASAGWPESSAPRVGPARARAARAAGAGRTPDDGAETPGRAAGRAGEPRPRGRWDRRRVTGR